MQTVDAIAEAVWHDIMAANPETGPGEMPRGHAHLLAGALAEHLAHRFLLLNRVRLPPGACFRPPPAYKPMPPVAQWRAAAQDYMRRALHEPLTLVDGLKVDCVHAQTWLNEQVERRFEAENAPVTKLKMHGQLVCRLEQRLVKRLVRESAQWWQKGADDSAASERANDGSGAAQQGSGCPASLAVGIV